MSTTRSRNSSYITHQCSTHVRPKVSSKGGSFLPEVSVSRSGSTHGWSDMGAALMGNIRGHVDFFEFEGLAELPETFTSLPEVSVSRSGSTHGGSSSSSRRRRRRRRRRNVVRKWSMAMLALETYPSSFSYITRTTFLLLLLLLLLWPCSILCLIWRKQWPHMFLRYFSLHRLYSMSLQTRRNMCGHCFRQIRHKMEHGHAGFRNLSLLFLIYTCFFVIFHCIDYIRCHFRLPCFLTKPSPDGMSITLPSANT
jgi:hypothetical protein